MKTEKWWLWSALVIVAAGVGCSFDSIMPKAQIDAVGLETINSPNGDSNGKTDDGIPYNPPPPDVDHPPDTTVAEPNHHQDSMDIDVIDTDAPSPESSPPEGEEVVGDADAPSTSSGDIDASDADAETETDAPFVCVPQCQDKQCGDNNCSGSCGECPEGWECNAAYFCQCVLGCPSVAEDVKSGEVTDIVESPKVDVADMANADAPSPESSPTEGEEVVAETNDTVDALETQDAETVIMPPCVINPLLCADTPPAPVDMEVVATEPATVEQPQVVEPNASEPTTVELAVAEPVAIVEPTTAEPGPDAQISSTDAPDTIDTVDTAATEPEAETVVIILPDTSVNIDAQVVETAPPAEDTLAEVEVETTAQPDASTPQPCITDQTLCDDNNICTDDSCDPTMGCIHSNNTVACADGDSCTASDVCENSVCVPGAPVACDDSDDCTDDYCQKGIGCVNEWVCKCVSNAACDDQNPCTDNVCANGFCEYAPNSALCDDNNACTTTDQCVGGECLGIAPLNCDDDNQCTFDSCDPTSGCQHNSMDGSKCDDNNACTTADTCQNKECQGGPALNCDDFNLCTDDSCDPIQGCQHNDNNANCDDNSVCTMTDICTGGICTGNEPIDCDDLNPCTKDACDKIAGCIHNKTAMSGAPCDDNNACTTIDTCQNGACTGSTPPNCDDSNKCTLDSCDKITGCQHADTSAACTDGNFCTDDGCVATQGCVFFNNNAPCTNDFNVCTDDICQNGACAHLPSTSSGDIACDDGNVCTMTDTCNGGSCTGANPKTCQDFNPCTDDTCDPVNNCQFIPNTASCDDNNQCTDSDTCGGGTCKGAAKADYTTCVVTNQCGLDYCQTGMCQINNLPQTDFETGQLETGWSKEVDYAAKIEVMSDNTADPGGSKPYSGAYQLMYQGSDPSKTGKLLSPTFYLPKGQTAKLVVQHKFVSVSTDSKTMQIMLKTENQSWVLLEHANNNPVTETWQSLTIDISPYTCTQCQLVFTFTGSNWQYLDAIQTGCF